MIRNHRSHHRYQTLSRSYMHLHSYTQVFQMDHKPHLHQCLANKLHYSHNYFQGKYTKHLLQLLLRYSCKLYYRCIPESQTHHKPHLHQCLANNLHHSRIQLYCMCKLHFHQLLRNRSCRQHCPCSL